MIKKYTKTSLIHRVGTAGKCENLGHTKIMDTLCVILLICLCFVADEAKSVKVSLAGSETK